AIPAGKSDHIEFFANQPGFGLRGWRRPSGDRKAFIYQYKIAGATYRMTLGDARKVKLTAALAAMQIAAGEIASKNNPAKARRAEREATRLAKASLKAAKARKDFGETVSEYLAARTADTKPRSLVEIKRSLEKQFAAFNELYLDAIDR